VVVVVVMVVVMRKWGAGVLLYNKLAL